jgi:hypothetical protein
MSTSEPDISVPVETLKEPAVPPTATPPPTATDPVTAGLTTAEADPVPVPVS